MIKIALFLSLILWILRVAGVLHISMWWVFSPLILTAAFVVAMFTAWLVFAFAWMKNA